ncbi:hypothetical protein OG429_32325 [Streptomyces sp. NBC_00190]|uniref:hypothetical protein n=1 Tax=Streptomyces sp. NBC_00190 TaxID=2903634 RepID=UPI002E29C7EE|nr:hypothetical protein [Streptomyces sp. NBC_00190]
MSTDEQILNQLQALQEGQERIEAQIEGLATRVGGIETKVDDLQKGQRLLATKLDVLAQTSEEQHKGIFDTLLGMNDIAHERITRVEKHLNLPPLD